MKIGLVQTGKIGDIIIALPIAQHFIDQGHEVFWPIDERWFGFFKEAAPQVNFKPVQHKFAIPDSIEYLLEYPKSIVHHYGCDKVYILYSNFYNVFTERDHLANSLKFDEFKYAISGVPFQKKWTLSVVRNVVREAELISKLNIRGNYVVTHDTGSDAQEKVNIELPEEIRDTCQVIPISQISDSPFDWIPVFEGAKELFLIDSAPANLVEQLGIKTKKTLYLRSAVGFTPVYSNGWAFK
jgi:hypothetical protein